MALNFIKTRVHVLIQISLFKILFIYVFIYLFLSATWLEQDSYGRLQILNIIVLSSWREKWTISFFLFISNSFLLASVSFNCIAQP